MTEHSAQRFLYSFRGLYFLGFSYFLLYSAQCLSVSECETRRNWLQTVLSHRTTHHKPASTTFEAPWMEHAQWRPVNKSLVEALMAVAHLVRLCTDPDSDQGPPAHYHAHSFNLQIQKANGRALDEKISCLRVACLRLRINTMHTEIQAHNPCVCTD